MKLQEKFKLGSWISNRTNKPYNWGTWDCNIFFVEYHDMMYGTTDLDRIKDKYKDRRSGIRVLRDFGLTPGQWLTLRNYKKGKKRLPEWRDGDVALIEHKYHASVYIYFDGAFWTVEENTGMKGIVPDAVANVMTSWWRKNG